MNNKIRKRKNLLWKVGYSEKEDETPRKYIPASVPGAVQLDWARAHGWESCNYADNYKAYLWMEDVYWVYTAAFEPARIGARARLFFVCKGVDYRFKVKLNGNTVYEYEGMFTPFELDLTETAAAGGNLEIHIYPVPKRKGAAFGKQQADESVKPACSYGWDWHPRLIPTGIWQDAYIEIRPECHIRETELTYTLSDNFSEVFVTLKVSLSKPSDFPVKWRLFDGGNEIFKIENETAEAEFTLTARLDSPKLWWPNGQGDAALYLSRLELLDENGEVTDFRQTRAGFRKAELVMHPGAWDEPNKFPKTRSDPPITVEINGRQIFCKGSNWVPPEIFPGVITAQTYRPLLEMARDANMNILRSWGGGIVNKEEFFELCDEFGIMVWQEFPLACNDYKSTPRYLDVLNFESRSIIKKVKSHPCVVLLCGGNELFNSWSGMTEQSPALRLLNKNCFELAPEIPFIMTSPLMGMAHGHYVFRDEAGKDVFQIMAEAKATAYVEFGCPSPSPAGYLKTFIPESELFPPRKGTAWESHHAFNAWEGDTWLMPGVIEYYFGKSETLEHLSERGQLLQSEGYKCIFEEARRQKPSCSMAVNWCYNEPWPTAANNSLINWPCLPKPAYYAVKSSCRPVLASARIPKFDWRKGEEFYAELWILNDSPHCIPAGRIDVFTETDGNKTLIHSWHYPDIPANSNLKGDMVRCIMPCAANNRIKLILEADGGRSMNSEYTVICKNT